MPKPDSLRCSSRIAAGLLDVLAIKGDVAGGARARQAMGPEAAHVRATGAWISRDALENAFRALAVDRRLAQRVGRALVANETLGLFLCYAGFATVEKAYRRCDQILAREDARGAYQALEIDGRSAKIVYDPGPRPVAADPPPKRHEGQGFCGVREGMLAAIPLCFGLLPAEVRETECAERGASRCVFDVRWSTTSRKGLWIGAALGLVAGLGIAAATFQIVPWWMPVVGVSVLALLAAAAGRTVDLVRQLEAVAGSRRGQLALLDQADSSLAEKMDELAKLSASIERARGEGAEVRGPGGLRLGDHEGGGRDGGLSGEASEQILRTCEELYRALGPLHRGLAELHGEIGEDPGPAKSSKKGGRGKRAEEGRPEASRQALRRCTLEAQRIQDLSSGLARHLGGADRLRRAVSLAEVVHRAADLLRPHLNPGIRIDLELASGLPPVHGEPFEVEQVVQQLLESAAASMEAGKVQVSLCASDAGLELVVCDPGRVIDPEVLEHIFDPFDSDVRIDTERGRGLRECFQIVRDHDGELRVASREEGGTRVTVVLPASLVGGNSPAAATEEPG